MNRLVNSLIAGAVLLMFAGRARAQTTTAESVARALNRFAESVDAANANYKLMVDPNDTEGRRRTCVSTAAASHWGAELTAETNALAAGVNPSLIAPVLRRRRPFDEALGRIRRALDGFGGCTIKVVPVPVGPGPGSAGSENGPGTGQGSGNPGSAPGTTPKIGSGGSGSKSRELDLLLAMSNDANERTFALVDEKGKQVEIRPPLLRELLTDLTNKPAPTILGPVSLETAASDVGKLIEFVSEHPEKVAPAFERLVVPAAELLVESAVEYRAEPPGSNEAVKLLESYKKARLDESAKKKIDFEDFDEWQTTTAWLRDFKKDKASAASYRELFTGQTLNLKVKRGNQTVIIEIRPDLELETTSNDKLKIDSVEITPSDVDGLVPLNAKP